MVDFLASTYTEPKQCAHVRDNVREAVRNGAPPSKNPYYC